ncbi:hypothetical protein [Haloferax volcanii]|uniref:Uncharacterized protein n=3 Tax=Haloferax volcanii TaxID=2246 RepID=A0A384KUK3_HALVD|nr:hypothetical protein [Haloferax volcanii]ADE04266.1 uncharacterized protein HVO_2647 [Haloferax volcanii DS2]ELY32554.1 hypothetical protein C498_08515 [Haloferax volcanii DS2]MBS8118407.1 hypothetical protein [Haloferax volcanii]MBS8123420.1 hypothetical protein [Haloferax volcanii]MBS8127288.1 hypothetical protein [Haloferax volcanii]
MQFSSWRWNRIIAFLGGAGLLFWVPWSGLSPVLPEWTIDVLRSVPLGLCVYGFTEQPRNVIAMVPAGTALGVGILALYRAFGFGLF